MSLREIEFFARVKMAEHGLDTKGWTFHWNDGKRQAGVCKYGPKRIEVSRYVAARQPMAIMQDTVLHEIAHALSPIGSGHGDEWKRTCVRIGANPNRTYEVSEEQVADSPWIGQCPRNPEHKASRHQQPVRVNSCSKCSKKFLPSAILKWSFNGRPMPVERLHPRYRAEYARITAGAAPRAEQQLWDTIQNAAERPKPATRTSSAQLIDFVSVGDKVQLVRVRGHQSTVATVVKVGRTRYHVRIAGMPGLFAVPMTAVKKV